METTTTYKICKDCGIPHPITNFFKFKRGQGGTHVRCKGCHKRKYGGKYKMSAEEFKERYGLTRSEYMKKWYQENKEKHKKNVQKYHTNRLKIDPDYRNEINLRDRLSRVMRGETIKGRTFKKTFGYSVQEFLDALKPQHDAIVAQGKKPHLDHLIPWSYFEKNTDPKIICSLENMRYVTSDSNYIKRNGYVSFVSVDYLNLAIDHIQEKYLRTFTFLK